jgi:hypothetical protein
MNLVILQFAVMLKGRYPSFVDFENPPEQIESYLSFRRFLLRIFANSRGRPKNKNISLIPFSRQEHQNFSTTRTGIRAILHEVQAVEGGRGEAASHQNYPIEEKHQEILKRFLGVGTRGKLLANFLFSRGSWNIIPTKRVR